MPKIVAVHVGEKPTALSLLKQVDEAGFLDSIKAGISAFKNKRNDAPAAEEKPLVRKTSSIADNSALFSLSSELITVPSGEVRVVLFLSHADLKKNYLVSGGGAAMVDELSDEEITNFAGGAGDSRLVKKSGKLKISDLIEAPAGASGIDRAVQINAPSSLMSEIEAKRGNIEELKPLIKKLMSHGLYVMTLNITKTKRMDATVLGMTSVDDLVEKFDPSIIENFPDRTVLNQARSEYISKNTTPSADDAEEARVADLERKGSRAERERAAQEKITGPTSSEVDRMVQIISASRDAAAAAAALEGRFISTGAMTRSDLISKLSALKSSYRMLRVQEVIDKL